MGNSHVVEALFSTLEGIEQSGTFAPEDPALLELGRSVMSLIAALLMSEACLDLARAEADLLEIEAATNSPVTA